MWTWCSWRAGLSPPEASGTTHADGTWVGCAGLGAGAAAPHPAHLCVPRQDCNTSLVRACWNELFTLGLAQCAQVMSLSTILAAIVNHLQNSIQEGMHWRRKWQPTPVFLPGESQGRGSLVGRRLWGHTESDSTEAT